MKESALSLNLGMINCVLCTLLCCSFINSCVNSILTFKPCCPAKERDELRAVSNIAHLAFSEIAGPLILYCICGWEAVD